MQTEQSFKQVLMSHDWYYMYSDDPSYYRAGSTSYSIINMKHNRLQCPFSIKELEAWRFKMVLEDFEKTGEDMYQQRVGDKYGHKKKAKRSDLLEKSRYDLIDRWLSDKE